MKKRIVELIRENKKIVFLIVINIIILIFVYNNAFLYSKTLVKINSVHNSYLSTEVNLMNYKEKYYNQTIEGYLLNGEQKGKTVTMKNKYGESLVYGEKYRVGDIVFVEHLAKNNNVKFKANINSKKRDFYFVLFLLILIDLLILIGRKTGIFTLVSLALNSIIFVFILYMNSKGYHLIYLTIPAIIFVSAVTFLLMNGFKKKTAISFFSTIITMSIIYTISALLIKYCGNIDYDFMDYIKEPYTQYDADIIFTAQLLITGLGAVMDVAVTIAATSGELVDINSKISASRLLSACRSVGDDITGTMINVVFFTNVVAGLPFFVLSMRNGISLRSIFHYHMFFDISRFLICGIGILVCIPITIMVSMFILKERKNIL